MAEHHQNNFYSKKKVKKNCRHCIKISFLNVRSSLTYKTEKALPIELNIKVKIISRGLWPNYWKPKASKLHIKLCQHCELMYIIIMAPIISNIVYAHIFHLSL